MQQDAARQMGEARLDAAQSSLLRGRLRSNREQALATRLQTRIQDEAAEAMRNAQSLYNRANTEQYMGRSMKAENLSNGHPALRIRPGRKYPPQMVKCLTRHLHSNEDSRRFSRNRGSFLTPPCRAAPEEQPPKTALPDTSLPVFPHITGHKASTLPLTRASRASNSRFASSPRHNLSVSDCCQ